MRVFKSTLKGKNLRLTVDRRQNKISLRRHLKAVQLDFKDLRFVRYLPVKTRKRGLTYLDYTRGRGRKLFEITLAEEVSREIENQNNFSIEDERSS